MQFGSTKYASVKQATAAAMDGVDNFTTPHCAVIDLFLTNFSDSLLSVEAERRDSCLYNQGIGMSGYHFFLISGYLDTMAWILEYHGYLDSWMP